MRLIRLSTETDFDGWRTAARSLRLAGVPPGKVAWTVNGSEVDLAFPEGRASVDAAGVGEGALTVPKAFADLAADVVLHRSPERFALLYRLLFRLSENARLMDEGGDPDVAMARDLARAVRESARRMVAEITLRPVGGGPPLVHIGWCAPNHRVAAMAGPALAALYARTRFTVLTPEASVHWDTKTLAFDPGAPLGDSPSDAALDDHWRKRCAFRFQGGPVGAPMAFARDAPTREMKAAARRSREGPYLEGRR